MLVYGMTESTCAMPYIPTNSDVQLVILMLRLHAMYGQSKKVMSLIVPTFLVVLALELVILVLSSLAQEGWLHRTVYP